MAIPEKTASDWQGCREREPLHAAGRMQTDPVTVEMLAKLPYPAENRVSGCTTPR